MSNVDIKLFKQTSTSLPWDIPDDRTSHLTPPPQKRIKSVDLYRAQHGISPSELELGKDTDIQPIPAHHRQRNRNSDRSRDRSRDLSRSRERSRDSTRERERDRSDEMRESLLGQALEGGPTLIVPSVLQFHKITASDGNLFYLVFSLSFFRIKETITSRSGNVTSTKHWRRLE